MRALCVGRHPFLSEHLGRFFGNLGLDCLPCVGLTEAMDLVPVHQPDVVICDYDLLATMSLASWESEPGLSDLPLIAVSLTRHPGEAHLMDVNGIAGFLYLPTLDPSDAHRVLSALKPRDARINPPNGLEWPATSQVPQLR
jgi:DNA-binding NarL/FixJ family response regulator